MQDQDITIGPAFFLDHIQAGNSKIYTALPHANDDIPRALEDHTQICKCRDSRLILPWVRLEDPQACRGKKI